jgi:hypothetical protein
MNTVPVETARQSLEVIPTTTATHYEPGRARMVYGFAYRCKDCHGIWMHRQEAVKHPCSGSALMAKAPILIQRVL